jgi:hypothetical protein
VKEGGMGRACSKNGQKRNACRLLVEMPEGKRPLGRTRLRWLDNVLLDVRETGTSDMDWTGLDWTGLM